MSNEITRNRDESRYEIRSGGELAGFADYRDEGDVLVFTHTEVDSAFEGKGIGGALVRGALDDVRARGVKVRPLCPFVRAWIDRHPDYADLVA